MLKQFVASRQLISTLFLITLHFAVVDRANGQEAKQEWGNLSATFLYDGEPPEPEKFVIKKNADAFKLPLFDESLIVDGKTKGIANVVVWLYLKSADPRPIVHPDYEKAAKAPVEMTVHNARYEPRITTLRVGQVWKILNADPVGHNLKGDLFSNSSLGVLLPVGVYPVTKTFTKSESRPMPLADNLYPWMTGWLLIKDHPYMAVSNKQGKLQIKNLPVGNHTFVLFHELPGFVRAAKRNGEVQEFKYGRLTVDIKPDDNELGEFLIKPEKRPFP